VISAEEGGVITSGEMNNLFDNLSGDEGKAGDTEYRGVYVVNDGDTTLIGTKLWVKQDADSPDDATAIALADEAVNVAMETIANESTAPSGPTFSAPASKEAGLTIGDIPAGQFKGVWVRRTITAEADAQDEVEFILRAEGDSAQ